MEGEENDMQEKALSWDSNPGHLHRGASASVHGAPTQLATWDSSWVIFRLTGLTNPDNQLC